MSVPVPTRDAIEDLNGLERIAFRVLLAVECERALANEPAEIPFMRAMSVLDKHGAFLRDPPPPPERAKKR